MVTAQLVCAFVLAYAKSMFSRDVAQIIEWDFLSFFHKKNSCGCLLKLPSQGDSGEHPQHIGFYKELSKIPLLLSWNSTKFVPLKQAYILPMLVKTNKDKDFVL